MSWKPNTLKIVLCLLAIIEISGIVALNWFGYMRVGTSETTCLLIALAIVGVLLLPGQIRFILTGKKRGE